MNENTSIGLVTGAGSGIGRSSTLKLLEAGYSVILAGRRKEALVETKDMSGTDSARAIVVPTDVCDAKSVQNLFQKTLKQFGRLDLLFNNAGIGAPAIPLDELTVEQWKSVVDVNLNGVFLCTQEAFRIMKKQEPCGGRIINNGSISAHVPRPYSAPYTSTKHAITGLTRSTSLDGRQHNIACGQIDIGNAATEMTAKMHKGIIQANGNIEVEPTMDVDNVAKAIVYMASLPLDANIQFMTVMASSMPYIGRG